MTNGTRPSPDQQLDFLRSIQRLLSEGGFVASYKFALLHALADLAILRGDDTGATLPLSTQDIAERFIELYWQQARPYHVAGAHTGIILRQNAGRQAAVINSIERAQAAYGGSLYRLRQDETAWHSLVRDVATTVRQMPLWKLQTVGPERLDFLYDNTGAGSTIVLKPGVGYCLRAFHELLCSLFRAAWTDYLRRHNTEDLGQTTDLQDFLFGDNRTSLDAYRVILRDVQRGTCFYCGRGIQTNADVDHYIPWSRCRSDLGHNLVLAHRSCNNAKSDHLASEVHLEAWVARNSELRTEMEQRFSEGALLHDLDASIRIAQWAYSHTEQANGQVWTRARELTRLDGSWRHLLVA